MNVIEPHCAVNGVPFGCSEVTLQEQLGTPDKIGQNYTGEIEMLYGASIFRCLNGRFVECTLPDRGRTRVGGVDIMSMFDWLGAAPDVVDKAKFRISLHYGIAYDNRYPDRGSITVFERGRWDALVLGSRG